MLSFPLWRTLYGYCRWSIIKDKLESDDTTGLIHDRVSECETREKEGKETGKESHQSQGAVKSPSVLQCWPLLIYSTGRLRTSQHSHSHGYMCERTCRDTHMEVCICAMGDRKEYIYTYTHCKK